MYSRPTYLSTDSTQVSLVVKSVNGQTSQSSSQHSSSTTPIGQLSSVGGVGAAVRRGSGSQGSISTPETESSSQTTTDTTASLDDRRKDAAEAAAAAAATATTTDVATDDAEDENEPPPPPVAARPERTKSIVKKIYIYI